MPVQKVVYAQITKTLFLHECGRFSTHINWHPHPQEWEVVTKAYPATARFLNRVTKQVDVTIYDPAGNVVDVSGMRIDIILVIGRMTHKDPSAVKIPGEERRAKMTLHFF